LFYQRLGSGQPCLVLHGGFGLDHTYLQPWLDPLADRFQLVFYDQRGNGRSDPAPCASITFEQLCADADALRALFGVERIALAGHSLGGFVALEYALRYPARVSHLLLIDTAPSFDYGAEIMANVEARQPTPEVLEAVSAPPPATDAEFARLWHAVLPLYFHRYTADPAASAFARTHFRAAAAACNDGLFAGYDVSSRLAEIQAPAWVVAGEDDFVCPPSQARRLHAGLAHAHLTILPACGHFPFLERPNDFAAALRAWLAQVDRAEQVQIS
jgi:proline iminopeptidase